MLYGHISNSDLHFVTKWIFGKAIFGEIMAFKALYESWKKC